MKRVLLATVSVWCVGALALRAAVAPAASCPELDATVAHASVLNAATWITNAQEPAGTYLYQFNRESSATLDDYNVVRHAGVTMSLYQLAAAGDLSVLGVADRALAYMQANLFRRDGWAAFRDPRTGSIQLGASALLLAGLDQRRLATNDPTYDQLMREVARFIVLMQRQDGAFLASWLPSTGAPDPWETSKYATGEAFWALAMIHEAFPREGWDAPTRLVADYLSARRDAEEGFDFPPWADQWAAYGLAEMADWPLNEENVAYARSLSKRFGLLVRIESGRRDTRWSDFVHGRQARAAGIGTWVEALTSLWRLSKDEPRLADLTDKLGERVRCGAGMLAARQVDSSTQTDTRIAGAWFTKDVTRMDDQQHALSALLRSEAILENSTK